MSLGRRRSAGLRSHLCCESGWAQLLGRRATPRPECSSTLPGSAASLSPTPSPRCLWREGAPRERREGGEGSGGNSTGGLSRPPLPLQPTGLERPRRGGATPIPAPGLPSPCTRRHSAHPALTRSPRCTHPPVHTSHPHSSHTQLQACVLLLSQDTPDPHLCPAQPHPCTATPCAGTHAHAHHRTHACTYVSHIH